MGKRVINILKQIACLALVFAFAIGTLWLIFDGIDREMARRANLEVVK